MSNTVKVHLVDGSYSEWQAQASILQEHDELVRQGYGGKKLIHRLISGSICFPCKKSRFEIKQGPPAATQSAPLMATQTAPPGWG